MALVKIYQDSRGMGTCRSCGARIEWAESMTGRRIPFDGCIVATRTQGGLMPDVGRIIELVDTTVSPTHFERCPDAKTWRRK